MFTLPPGSFLALPYNYKPEINGKAYGSHRELLAHVVEIEKRMIGRLLHAAQACPARSARAGSQNE